MPRAHLIAIKGPDGQPQLHPMRQWLRAHAGEAAPDLDPTASNSHQMRAALDRHGWKIHYRPDRVLAVRPEAGDTSYADSVVNDIDDDGDVTVETIEQAEEITFGLERDLQAALRANIEQLEPGLALMDEGRERSTEAGRIDITATDSAGRTVVIELKAGAAPTDVVTQTLAYMAAVSTGEKSVRGIIVAGDFPNRVVLAARAVPNLELRRYGFQFKFSAVK